LSLSGRQAAGLIAMKLLRYGPVGRELPGMLDAYGVLRDLSSIIVDVAGGALSEEILGKLSRLGPHRLPVVQGNPRLGACVAGIGKFICIGLNYADHAAETGMSVPSEPVVFLKATSAVCGPDDAIIKPRDSTKLDWEVELGVVIGKTASYVS